MPLWLHQHLVEAAYVAHVLGGIIGETLAFVAFCAGMSGLAVCFF
jgi:hypothetical protein